MTTQRSTITYPRYHSLLTSKGFIFSHSQKGHGIGGGYEDVYTHPDFKFNTYIGPIEAHGATTLHTGDRNAEAFDRVHKHSEETEKQYVWHGDNIDTLVQGL